MANPAPVRPVRPTTPKESTPMSTENSPTDPRPYLSAKHLETLIPVGDGIARIYPLEADRIRVDMAHESHRPSMARTTPNGSSAMTVDGLLARASALLVRVGGDWELSGYESVTIDGSTATPRRVAIVTDELRQAVAEWARTHEADIAQADDIRRNNAARTLEESIREHEQALAILHAQLRQCEEGEPYTEYPSLPTVR